MDEGGEDAMISKTEAKDLIQNRTAGAVAMPNTQKFTRRPIEALAPWARNARTHSKKQIRRWRTVFASSDSLTQC